MNLTKASTITSTTRHGNLPRHNSMLFDTSVFMVDCPFRTKTLVLPRRAFQRLQLIFVIPRQLLRSDTFGF
jgi:hypothetical protein